MASQSLILQTHENKDQ